MKNYPLTEEEREQPVKAVLNAAKVWQPIETAPKEIVERCNNSEYGAKILAWPIYGSVSVVYWWQWRENSGEINGSNFLDEGGNGHSPLLWMSIPQPTEEEKEAAYAQ